MGAETIRVTAGLLVRGTVRRAIRNVGEDMGLQVDVEQDGPDIRFRLNGDDAVISRFKQSVARMIESYNEE